MRTARSITSTHGGRAAPPGPLAASRRRVLRSASGAVMVMMMLGVAACGGSRMTGPSGPQTFSFDFRDGPQGWVSGFTNYPASQEAFFELVADYRALEPPLSGSALYIAGTNYSENLFMFQKRRVTGLDPSRTYAVTFLVEIATNVPYGCFGIGGAPGESVRVMVGATPMEPVRSIEANGQWHLNIDSDRRFPTQAVKIGDIANQIECRAVPGVGIVMEWQLKALQSAPGALQVRPDAAGAVWLLGATHSGYGGRTGIYFTRYSATFTPE